MNRRCLPRPGAQPPRTAVAALAALAACAGPRAVLAPAPAADTRGGDGALRVMTFNIRYGSAADGADSWPLRRAFAIRVIRDFDPALLGLQEALRPQLDDLAQALPFYDQVGVGRDDGRVGGEHAAILFDRRRFALLEQGTFWLSDSPDVPGSMTWGNRFPRVVSWAHLVDRSPGTAFYLFNTHWDHESQPSRDRSAALLLQRMRTRAQPADPVLVTGDFNAAEDNPAFRALLALPLVDTFRALYPSAAPVGTFHAFRGDRSGPKIDAVLASPAWHAVAAAIVDTAENGRYPSDHFPVTATLVPRAGP